MEYILVFIVLHMNILQKFHQTFKDITVRFLEWKLEIASESFIPISNSSLLKRHRYKIFENKKRNEGRIFEMKAMGERPNDYGWICPL